MARIGTEGKETIGFFILFHWMRTSNLLLTRMYLILAGVTNEPVEPTDP